MRWIPLRAGRVDLRARQMHAGSQCTPLSELETKVLAYLAARPGEPVTRDALLCDVWGFARPVATRAVDNTVMRLRSRIEVDPRSPDHVCSIRGVGYVFHPLEQAASSLERDVHEALNGGSAGRDAALRRLRDRAISATEQVWGPGSRDALDELTAIREALADHLHDIAADDTELACELMLSLKESLLLAGPAPVDWGEQATTWAADVGRADLAERVGILHAALLHNEGRIPRAVSVLDAIRPSDPALDAERRMRLGYARALLGEVADGVLELERAVHIASGIPDKRLVAQASTRLGSVHSIVGDLDAARRALRHAFALHQEAGDEAAEARTLGNLALFDLERGELDRAERAFQRALEYEQRHGGRLAQLQLRLNLAGLAHVRGDARRAIVLFRTVRDDAADAGDMWTESLAWHGLGVAALDLDDRHEARRCLGRARVGLQRGGHAVWVSVANAWMAVVDHAEGDHSGALESLHAARTAGGAQHEPTAVLLALVTARIEADAARWQAACERADALAPTSSSTRVALRVLRSAGPLADVDGGPVLDRERV